MFSHQQGYYRWDVRAGAKHTQPHHNQPEGPRVILRQLSYHLELNPTELIWAPVVKRVTFKLDSVKLADERLETGAKICKLPTLNAWAMKIFWTDRTIL